MDSPATLQQERTIYDLYLIAVLVKGIEGIVELVASVVVYLIPLHAVTALADHFTEDELAQDPDDFIASHLYDYAHSISIGSKDFAALYLLLHGIVKLFLALALLSGKRWAYPAGLVILGALILYQGYRVLLHRSALLALATVLDCVIWYLIFREYAITRRRRGMRAV